MPVPDLAPVARSLVTLPGVRAVFVGGSRASGLADEASDTDLYALHRGALAGPAAREAALLPHADSMVTSIDTWGPESHFAIAGQEVEVVYLDLAGLALDTFYGAGAAPTGYTTAFLHTLAHGRPVADPHGELAAIQARLTTYPEATRRRILEQAPGELASYIDQLRKAQSRGDWTNVTSRRAAIQATWFDLLFALNRVYHPGEKRLLTHLERCPLAPDAARARWASVSLLAADDPRLAEGLATLVSELVAMI